MSDFFTRLAERTLGLIPTVKPLIAPIFTQGLMWGRDRAFDALFRRQSRANLSEQGEALKGVMEPSTVRVPPLVGSSQAVPLGLSSVAIADVSGSSPSFPGETVAAQTLLNLPHQASLTQALTISASGELLSSSETIQPQTHFAHPAIQRSSDPAIAPEELNFPGHLSESSSMGREVSESQSKPDAIAPMLMENQPFDFDSTHNSDFRDQSTIQPNIQSESSITITTSSESFHQPLIDVSRRSLTDPPIEQANQVNSQASPSNNLIEHTILARPPIELSNPVHSQSPSIQEHVEQLHQEYSRATPNIQRQIQATQSQSLPRIAADPLNSSVSSSSPVLPLVRSQSSQTRVPSLRQIRVAESKNELSWDESLRNDNLVSPQNSFNRKEFEELEARVISGTPPTSLPDTASLIELNADLEVTPPKPTSPLETAIEKDLLTPRLPTSTTPTLPRPSTEQLNSSRDFETARSPHPRFYFRSSLTSSAAPVAVKPRLEPTELSSVMEAASSGALFSGSEERRSLIHSSLATEPAPTIQVTIGRVEVRGSTPSPAMRSQEPPIRQEARLSLEDYLKQREEGHR